MKTAILMLAAASSVFAKTKFSRVQDLIDNINHKIEETHVNIQNLDAGKLDN